LTSALKTFGRTPMKGEQERIFRQNSLQNVMKRLLNLDFVIWRVEFASVG